MRTFRLLGMFLGLLYFFSWFSVAYSQQVGVLEERNSDWKPICRGDTPLRPEEWIPVLPSKISSVWLRFAPDILAPDNSTDFGLGCSANLTYYNGEYGNTYLTPQMNFTQKVQEVRFRLHVRDTSAFGFNQNVTIKFVASWVHNLGGGGGTVVSGQLYNLDVLPTSSIGGGNWKVVDYVAVLPLSDSRFVNAQITFAPDDSIAVDDIDIVGTYQQPTPTITTSPTRTNTPKPTNTPVPVVPTSCSTAAPPATTCTTAATPYATTIHTYATPVPYAGPWVELPIDTPYTIGFNDTQINFVPAGNISCYSGGWQSQISSDFGASWWPSTPSTDKLVLLAGYPDSVINRARIRCTLSNRSGDVSYISISGSIPSGTCTTPVVQPTMCTAPQNTNTPIPFTGTPTNTPTGIRPGTFTPIPSKTATVTRTPSPTRTATRTPLATATAKAYGTDIWYDAPKQCDSVYGWTCGSSYDGLAGQCFYVPKIGQSDPNCTIPYGQAIGYGDIYRCPVGYIPSDEACGIEPTVTPTGTWTPSPTPTPDWDCWDACGTPTTPTPTVALVVIPECTCNQRDVYHPLYPVLCRQEILLCGIATSVALKQTPPVVNVIVTPGAPPMVTVVVNVYMQTPQPVSATTTATPISAGASCSGGNVSSSGGYTIHIFLTSGTLSCSGSGQAEFLLVGGGGGGSSGGGGAGGYLSGNVIIPSGSNSVVVGGGGAAGLYNSSAGGTGGVSSFLGYTAMGGGGGAYVNTGAGVSGASGGGGGSNSSTTSVGGGGTSPQGNAGGGNGGRLASPYPAGGGGGAGGVGGSASSASVAGIGGAGLNSTISGSSVGYAGGGGGGTGLGAGTPGSATHGGGAGNNNTGNGTAGAANTGGGGGGAGDGRSGGAGGSGIVIVRYSTYITPTVTPTSIVITPQIDPTATATPCLYCQAIIGMATTVANSQQLQATMVALLSVTKTQQVSATIFAEQPECIAPRVQAGLENIADGDITTGNTLAGVYNLAPYPVREIQLWSVGSGAVSLLKDDLELDNYAFSSSGKPTYKSVIFEPLWLDAVVVSNLTGGGIREMRICYDMDYHNEQPPLPGCVSPNNVVGGVLPENSYDQKLSTFMEVSEAVEFWLAPVPSELSGITLYGSFSEGVAYNVEVEINGSKFLRPLTLQGAGRYSPKQAYISLPYLLGVERVIIRPVVSEVTLNVNEISFCYGGSINGGDSVFSSGGSVGGAAGSMSTGCYSPADITPGFESLIDDQINSMLPVSNTISFDIIPGRLKSLDLWGLAEAGEGIAEFIIHSEDFTEPLNIPYEAIFNGGVSLLKPVKETIPLTHSIPNVTAIELVPLDDGDSDAMDLSEVVVCMDESDPDDEITPLAGCFTPLGAEGGTQPRRSIDERLGSYSQGSVTYAIQNGVLTGLDIWGVPTVGNEIRGFELVYAGVTTTTYIAYPMNFNRGEGDLFEPVRERAVFSTSLAGVQAVRVDTVSGAKLAEVTACFDTVVSNTPPTKSTLSCDANCYSPEFVQAATGQNYQALIDDDPNTCWLGGTDPAAKAKIEGVLHYMDGFTDLLAAKYPDQAGKINGANTVIQWVGGYGPDFLPDQFVIRVPQATNFEMTQLQFIAVGDDRNRVTQIQYASPLLSPVPIPLLTQWYNIEGNHILSQGIPGSATVVVPIAAGLIGKIPYIGVPAGKIFSLIGQPAAVLVGKWFESQWITSSRPGQLVKEEATFVEVLNAEYVRVKMARDNSQPPVMCEVCVCGNQISVGGPVAAAPTDWLRYVEFMCSMKLFICQDDGKVITPTAMMTQTVVISGNELLQRQAISTLMEIRDLLTKTGQLTPTNVISINLTPVFTIVYPTATPTITPTPTLTFTATLMPTYTPTSTPTPFVIVPISAIPIISTTSTCGAVMLSCPAALTDTVAAGYLMCLGMTAWEFNVDVPAPPLSPPYIRGKIHYCYVEDVRVLNVDATPYLLMMGMTFSFISFIFLAKRRHNS